MRSDARHYELIAPPSLDHVLRLLAEEPGTYTPLAGGTELMVALGAGRLAARKLVSLHHLRDLRFVSPSPESLTLGAGVTFSDLRKHPLVGEEFALLARAAGWTGSVANQNRGTLAGNIVNGSPAADSPPALLVYEATVNLVSVRGMRAVPYLEFHTGYKKTALAVDELVHSVVLMRRYREYQGYIRKVGTRNAQAISKVVIAGLALTDGGRVQDVRIAAASLREVPMRCAGAEAAIRGQEIGPETIRAARAALAAEVRPIDDIRSTARYRSAVAGNLLEEFLHTLR